MRCVVDGCQVYFLTTFVSLWQVLLGFLFAPLLSLPALGGLSLSDLPANFSQGWQCFTGGHVVGYECHISPPPYVVLLLYVVVNFVRSIEILHCNPGNTRRISYDSLICAATISCCCISSTMCSYSSSQSMAARCCS